MSKTGDATEPKPRGSNRPRGGIRWTLNHAAAEFGLDHSTLAKRLLAASIRASDDGCYSTAQILEAAVGDYQRERTRQVSAAADMQELQRDALRGSLVPITVMRGILYEIGIALKQIVDSCTMTQLEKENFCLNIQNLSDTNYAERVRRQLEHPDGDEEEKPEPKKGRTKNAGARKS